MLDALLKDCGLTNLLDGDVDVDSIPDLNWSMSFEEVSWDQQVSSLFPLKSRRQVFEKQEFRWDEAKFYDMDGMLSVASTESGSNFTDCYDDDVSALTHATGLTTVDEC